MIRGGLSSGAKVSVSFFSGFNGRQNEKTWELPNVRVRTSLKGKATTSAGPGARLESRGTNCRGHEGALVVLSRAEKAEELLLWDGLCCVQTPTIIPEFKVTLKVRRC